MPAFLTALLPYLLRMAGGAAGWSGAEALASKFLPKLAGPGILPGLGRAGIGSLGMAGADSLLEHVLPSGEPQPKDNNENLSVLLNRMNGGMGDSGFDAEVKKRQVQGTLMQALANAGVDPASLKGVL